MAKLRSKIEEVVEDVKEMVEDVVEELAPVIEAGEEDEEIANTTILDKATDLVCDKFGLGNDYSVTKFDCKGNKVKLELENRAFTVNVTVKDRIAFGLFNDSELEVF